MVPWRASDTGFVTDAVLEWYERLAHGRPGALVVEATGIRDIPSGPLLRIGDDRFVDGLSELVRRVHAASGGRTRVLIQLIDFLPVRRRPDRERYLRRFLRLRPEHFAISGLNATEEDAIRDWMVNLDDHSLHSLLDEREREALMFGYRERVTDTGLDSIRELPEVLPPLFADAAARARESGFDGVELHYAHAYTMASFLSAKNTRRDGYGGDRAGRARCPLAVYHAVRARVGNDWCVGCRMLADECIEGGNTPADATWFATEFARAGMDFLSFSRGGKFEDAKQPKPGWAVYPYTGPSGFECMPTAIADEFGPFGRNVENVGDIRRHLRSQNLETPVVVSGGIHDFSQAEGILEREEADIVGAARQSLADPDWWEKIRQGAGAEVNLCKYTNYCEGLDQKHKQVTCQLWDRKNLDEPGVSRSLDGKRRLVAPKWNGDDC